MGKIIIAIAWLGLNLLIIAVIFALPSKNERCLEMYPPQCHKFVNYGWPKSNFTLNTPNGKTTLVVNDDNIRKNALILALIIIPSMAVAFALGTGLTRANNRD